MHPHQELIARDRVIARINELFIATDERAWDRVESCFAPEVLFDMSSASGQPAQRLSGEEIAASWNSGLAGVEVIHHQAGNYVVTFEDAEAARAFCYGTATHYRKTTSGRNVRTFVGSYTFHLVGSDDLWRIDWFKFNLKYVDGNLNLEDD